MTTYQVIGKSVVSPDILDKAIGKARYTADNYPPGILKGKILHSPFAHGRIVKIDTHRAEKVPGVKAVITGQDIGKVRVGRFVKDRTILAYGKVRHIGEAVAAVAAIDEDTASEALSLVKVEYEELPAVFDPLEAMESKAPVIHEEVATYISPVPLYNKGNVLTEMHIRNGNMEEAWAQADLIHEDSHTCHRRFNVVQRGGKAAAHETLSARSKGISWDHRHLFLFQEFQCEGFGGHS